MINTSKLAFLELNMLFWVYAVFVRPNLSASITGAVQKHCKAALHQRISVKKKRQQPGLFFSENWASFYDLYLGLDYADISQKVAFCIK